MGREGIEPLAATSPIHGIRVTTGREDHDPAFEKMSDEMQTPARWVGAGG